MFNTCACMNQGAEELWPTRSASPPFFRPIVHIKHFQIKSSASASSTFFGHPLATWWFSHNSLFFAFAPCPGSNLQDESLTKDFAVNLSQSHRKHKGFFIRKTCINIHFLLLFLCKQKHRGLIRGIREGPFQEN